MSQARRTVSQAIALESATPRQMAALAVQYPELLREPRGNGHTVVVLPGFGASDRSTVALRRYLGRMGYEVCGWALGTNSGNVAALTPEVISILEQLSGQSRGSVSLVGWSMGGTISREVARQRPDLVRRVITMGSPITGGPKYTAFADQLAAEGVDLNEIERHLHVRQTTGKPLRVPVTAIFSRRDGVVAWQACIDQVNLDVEHVEVRCSHIGLGFDPEVYRIIVQRLNG